MKIKAIAVVGAAWFALGTCHAAERHDALKSAVDEAVKPVMAKNEIPGLTIGITSAGSHHVFYYGFASLESQRPVTDATLFEIGSITKTFTATLAAWAEIRGRLDLSDKTAKYLPSLAGTPFGEVTLLELGTHTPGGMPLQVPDTVQNDDQLMDFFRAWRPAYPPGTTRTYGNLSIGLLGLITAQVMHQDFAPLMEKELFAHLGLANTYIDLPTSKMTNYAQGYTNTGAPIRMKPGVLWAETYGVRTNAADLLRFLDANMGLLKLDRNLERAVADTHIGYFKAGALTQDLIWEQYDDRVTLETLLQGNSPGMLLDPNPAAPITPPLAPRTSVLIDKTGSTNGFGAYVAFIPARRVGVVILANKSYPIEDRVRLAYRILGLVDKSAAEMSQR